MEKTAVHSPEVNIQTEAWKELLQEYREAIHTVALDIRNNNPHLRLSEVIFFETLSESHSDDAELIIRELIEAGLIDNPNMFVRSVIERVALYMAPIPKPRSSAESYSKEDDDISGPLDWQKQALCAQTDPEAFFPEKGGSTKEAKRICVGCEVKSECLEYALGGDERFGIWGGLSERERRRLKRDTVIN